MKNDYLDLGFLTDEEIKSILISEKSLIDSYDVLKSMGIKIKGRTYDDVAEDILSKFNMSDIAHKEWFKNHMVIYGVPLTVLVNHRNSMSDKALASINDTSVDINWNDSGFVWKVVDNKKVTGVLKYDAKNKKVSVEGEIPFWLMQKATKFAETF